MYPEETPDWEEGWQPDAGLAAFERSENGASPARTPATGGPDAQQVPQEPATDGGEAWEDAWPPATPAQLPNSLSWGEEVQLPVPKRAGEAP